MTNESNFRLLLPVVKHFSGAKGCSVTSHKVLLSRDKYHQNKVENEWETEYPVLYRAGNYETSCS